MHPNQFGNTDNTSTHTSSASNKQPVETQRVHRFDTTFPAAQDGSYLGPNIGEMAQRLRDLLATYTAESGRRVVLIDVRKLALNDAGAGLGNGEDVYEVLVGFEDYSWLYPHTGQEVLATWTVQLTLTSGLGWIDAQGKESTLVTLPPARADVHALRPGDETNAAQPAIHGSAVDAADEFLPSSTSHLPER